ncbi:hypothetical protein QQ045_001914 [Rhodiola kirilowii]
MGLAKQSIDGVLTGFLLLICSISALHLRNNISSVCNWQGVKAYLNGRVSKLVLENLNLIGPLDEQLLHSLDQLRVLSFKRNSIYGEIPNLSSLRNLKSLFLDFNNFYGSFPASISELQSRQPVKQQPLRRNPDGVAQVTSVTRSLLAEQQIHRRNPSI